MTSQKTAARIPAAALALILLSALCLLAEAAPETEEPPLTLERIFASERFGPARWMPDGRSYTTVEDAPGVEVGRDIVLYRADTGSREILVPASALVPRGESKPLEIEDYDWSADGRRLLVFSNSRRVWRRNTRGNLWVLDRESGMLSRLGCGFDEARLMFAKLSPDGLRTAYVCMNDIYAEDIASGRIVRLIWDGSDDIINGPSDGSTRRNSASATVSGGVPTRPGSPSGVSTSPRSRTST